MGQKFTNNARSRLVGALSAAATSFTIEASTADLFPIANTPNWLAPVDWFKATIENSLGQVEIVKVGVRSLGSGVFSNVVRAQDGTSAIAFDAGSVVSLRFTASDLQAIFDAFETMVQITGDQTISGVKTFLQKVVGDLQGKADTAGHADTADSADAAETAETVTGTVADSAVGTTQPAKDASNKLATMAAVDRMRSMHASATVGTLVASDRGTRVPLPANITVPSGVFAKDDVVTLDNNSAGAKTIIQQGGLTMILVGTALTGNRTLAVHGVATLLFRSPTECVIMGGGLS